MPYTLRRGDVRIYGGPFATELRIVTWDGSSWVPLQGVVSVKFEASTIADPLCTIELRASFVDLDIKADRTEIRLEPGKPPT